MADLADNADSGIEERAADRIAEASRAASAIATGEPGECGSCGEDSPRLIDGDCAACRDKSERMRKINGNSSIA